MDLGITTRQSGSTTVVSVTGELDVHTATELELALREMISNGQHDVVVDLRGLGFLDSTGLSVLVKALKWAKEAGGGLRVVAADDKISKVFTITGLDQAMSLSPTLPDGVAD